MDERKQRGNRGEAVVAGYLRKNGYRLLESQFRCRFGEIDLIAQKKGVLCFVEVKLRSSDTHGLPREFVDGRKQEKFRKTAQYYLMEKDLDVPTRFDVAEVTVEQKDVPRVKEFHYIENAF